MIPMSSAGLNLERTRYKYLAYIVVRDAIGFYLGIPKFLSGIDKEQLVEERLRSKAGGKSDIDIEKTRKLISKAIDNRVANLTEDHEFAAGVLFEDNLWLQLLDINPDFFKTYLPKLSDEVIDELAVIPSWRERDEELRRPYQQQEYTPKNFKFK